MAGAGTRLRQASATVPKPLLPLLGRPLISYTLETLVRAGITNVYAVVGCGRQRVTAETKALVPHELNLQFVPNDNWEKQNGLSVLTVAGLPRSPFLLTMCDHLYDDAVLEVLLQRADPERLNVAVDRKIDTIFDLDDAMKVRTQDDRVMAIGKTLALFDAIDTGMFLCADSIFDFLQRAQVNGDCSLADGIRAAAEDDAVQVVDIGEAWWQDVDTPGMLSRAEEQLLIRADRNRVPTGRAEARPN
jgi:choline kinase